MKLRVKNNAVDHVRKCECFAIEPPAVCYKPYLNRNKTESSVFYL